jgi:hypothetical protein
MLVGSSTSPSSFIRPWQVGQASTSTAKVRASSSAQERYPPATSGIEGSALAVAAPAWGSACGARRDLQLDFGVLGASAQGTPFVRATVLVGVTWLLTAVSIRRLARVG